MPPDYLSPLRVLLDQTQARNQLDRPLNVKSLKYLSIWSGCRIWEYFHHATIKGYPTMEGKLPHNGQGVTLPWLESTNILGQMGTARRLSSVPLIGKVVSCCRTQWKKTFFNKITYELFPATVEASTNPCVTPQRHSFGACATMPQRHCQDCATPNRDARQQVHVGRIAGCHTTCMLTA